MLFKIIQPVQRIKQKGVLLNENICDSQSKTRAFEEENYM